MEPLLPSIRAKIKIIFVSPYTTDPEKKAPEEFFFSIFIQEYFFLISLFRRIDCPIY